MKIACPKCSQSDIRDGVCPNCGFVLTVTEVWRLYREKLTGFLRRKASIPCPHCGGDVQVTANLCPHCNNSVTANAVINTTLAPPRQRWRSFVRNATPVAMRRVQWVYLLLSSLALWYLLAYAQEHNEEHWVRDAALAAFFLAVMGFIVTLIFPSSLLQMVVNRAGWRVKLAMIANWLTLLLLLELLIDVWWAKALMLAGLFLVACLAIIILSIIRAYLLRPEGQQDTFDPSQPQGRRGRYD